MTHNQVIGSEEIGEQKGTFRAQASFIVSFLVLSALVIPATGYAYTLTNFKKVAPKIAADAEENYGDIVNIAALLHDYDEKLIISVIVVESEGKKTAVSNRGAQGLMQLMPATAKAMGAEDPKEPFQNVLAGTKYLKHLQDTYGFDTKESLVAYNMGPTRAKRWLSQYSPDESMYVQKVMHVYDVLTEEEKQQELAKKDAERNDANFLSSNMLTKPKTITYAELPIPNMLRRIDVTEE